MPEVQITTWRELPSMVAARADASAEPVKVLLAARFQEAIDEAAMRLGDSGADDYLAGWQRTAWESTTDADAAAAAERVGADLEARWSAEALTAYLDRLGGGSDD